MFKNSLIVLLFLLFPLGLYAQGLGVYAPPVGSGNALTIAHAYSGLTLNDGAAGGSLNPAGYLTDRNEMLVEGGFWTAPTFKTGVDYITPRLDVGKIAWLMRSTKGSIVLAFTPKSHFQAGALYKNPIADNGESEVVNRVSYYKYEFAFARPILDDYAFGTSVGWLRGTYATGILTYSSDQDTVHTPSMLEVTVGFRKITGKIRWAIVLEAPAMGDIVIRTPEASGVTIREKEEFRYQGAWGYRAGIGYHGQIIQTDFDLLIRDANAITVNSENLTGNGLMFSSGLALRIQFRQNMSLDFGGRWSTGDADPSKWLLFGIGSDYKLNEELSLQGAIGWLHPIGDSYSQTALDDATPLDIRVGILYYGK